MSPASVSEVPHDQTQGGGRAGVRLPHVREAIRESSQPQRAHVHGSPGDPDGGSERQPAAAAAAAAAATVLRPAHHHTDRGGGAARPGQMTTGRPGPGPGPAAAASHRCLTRNRRLTLNKKNFCVKGTTSSVISVDSDLIY